MKVLITGAHGALGSEVAKLYPNALVPTHNELDITDWQKVLLYFKKNQPELVIHLAALITIPACEKNKKLAWQTNVEGTANLVRVLKRIPNGAFVYMSTPCIFDGQNAPYNEVSIPYPQNFYGFTKYVGEFKAREAQKWMIIRSNFVAYKKWPHPRAFSDRFSNYLFAHDLARGIKDTIELAHGKIISWEKVYHVVGSKNLSMFNLAKMCPDSKDVKPFTLEEYYAANPKSLKLTENMSLKTINHTITFPITIPKSDKL